MTTLVRANVRSAHAGSAALATNGGPKAVTLPYREKWRSGWWKETRRLCSLLRLGITTSAISDGLLADFEQRFAAFTGCRYALAMNSGTATLHSALFAVGVGPGDEVILPSYTWHATASAVLCCSAKPVFCDVHPGTLTADPEDVERRITSKTKAILVVHVWGNPAELDKLTAIAAKHGLPLIEDCSHAHGASYQGKPVGSWGDVGCFSLQGGKAVSAGEGGIAVCSDRKYYARMLALGHPVRAGAELKDVYPDLGHVHLGPKYRPHLFGVALAFEALQRVNELNEGRRHAWKTLCSELAGCDEVTPVETLPAAVRGGFLEFKFVLDLDRLTCDREGFLKDLQAEGVAAAMPDRYGSLHRIGVFRHGGPLDLRLLESDSHRDSQPVELPQTDAMVGRIFTLPAYVRVSDDYLRQVAAAIRKVARHRSRSQGE